MRIMLAVLVLLLLPLSALQADVALAPLFSDGAVLQRDMALPVWGTAAPEEAVTVSLAGQEIRTKAGADGSWKVSLKPLKAGGPLEMKCRGAANEITVKDLLVGDVWLCSGQSNMAFTVSRALNPEQETAQADYPQIRFFTVPGRTAEQPVKDLKGAWKACSPASVGSFSAVGYFFGREMYRELKVPIGLINSSVGGTPAEAWTDAALLQADPSYKPLLDRWQKIIADYPAAKEKYDADLAAWKLVADKAKVDGTTPPRAPGAPQGPGSTGRPGSLYNAMINPLVPFGLKGAIWYQGESNASYAYQYRRLFPLMINNWRQVWGQGDFPFLFVQLAGFGRVPDPALPPEKDNAWAELREAQTMSLSVKNTGMALAIDIGDARDIHPKNKQEVGRRLALAALAQFYGRKIAWSGPMYETMSVEKGSIRLRFKHTEGGLVSSDGQPLAGFMIAGEDKVFAWATAVIDGDTVVVSSPAVAAPKAVRYAWGGTPACNLANKAGLPASPFRTDDWPGVTFGRE